MEINGSITFLSLPGVHSGKRILADGVLFRLQIIGLFRLQINIMVISFSSDWRRFLQVGD